MKTVGVRKRFDSHRKAEKDEKLKGNPKENILTITVMYSEFTNNVPLTPPAIRPLKVGSRWNRPSGG